MALKISCIGSGNMGYALMKGAVNGTAAGTGIDPESIGFCDEVKTKAEEAARSLGAIVYSTNKEAAKEGDIIFLAVKPQVMETVLNEIAPVLKGRSPVLVSMAPGWTIKKIQSITGNLPIARIMPNTPALISRSMTALALSPGFPEESAEALEKILSGAGLVDRVGETYLDAITGLSGSGPAFVYMFIESLADGGVKAGLPRDKALRFAAQTVLGSAAMVLEAGKHPGELKDMVASPGGTTIAGISALENGSFRGDVINAVEAAWKRSLELNPDR